MSDENNDFQKQFLGAVSILKKHGYNVFTKKDLKKMGVKIKEPPCYNKKNSYSTEPNQK